LTDCAKDAGVKIETRFGEVSDVWFYDNCSQYPPPRVIAWAGLATDDPISADVFVELDEQFAAEWDEHTGDVVDKDMYYEGKVVGLGMLNDAGCPFPVLANLIERVM
jgi:hypothetical protein